MEKKIIISWLICLLIMGTAFAQKKPNILFIFSDDHTWQAISAYGGILKDVAHTPNIDRLAKEGMLFKNCYVTNSICAPSRAVIQTGKYNHLNGIVNTWTAFNGSQQTFPKILRQHGYQTAILGKWHLISNPQGYDYWNVLPGQGSYVDPLLIKGDINGRIEEKTYRGHNNDVMGNLALEWLENIRNPNKPFMFMYQFKSTHGPWEPAKEEQDMFDSIAIPEPPNLLDDYKYRGTAARKQDMNIRYTMSTGLVKLNRPDVKAEWNTLGFRWEDKQNDDLLRWKYKRFLQDYLATAAGMDKNIGRVLKYLDDNGLTGNTVVIYSSDQGLYVGEHGWWDKRFMYEESLRMPFIVRWPGVIKPGSVNDRDIVSNLDFPETFLEIAGAPIPGDMQGRSLLPLFQGQTPKDWRKSFYYEFIEGETSVHKVYRHYGVTTGRYKLIYFWPLNEWEFYDIKKDPHEMINQYFIPENDSLVGALKEELVRLRKEFKAGDGPDIRKAGSWDYEKWTTPLKLGGCTDEKYLEYDPEADSLVAGACQTLGVRSRQAPHLYGLKIISGRSAGKLIFDAADVKGPVASISVYGPDGRRLKELKFGPEKQATWDVSGVNSGIYLLQVMTKGETGHGKDHIRFLMPINIY